MSDTDDSSDRFQSQSSTPPRKKTRQHIRAKFNNAWLAQENQEWLRLMENNPYGAFCACCNATLVCEISTLKRHGERIKYKSNIKNLACTTGMAQPELTTFFYQRYAI